MQHQTHPRAIGIDVGKASIHLAAADPATPPPAWKAYEIPLQGDWPAELAHYAPPNSLVVLEPTGWNYSLPIARTLEHIGAHVLYTSNHAAEKIRSVHVSQHKTDPNDARALAVIARMHAQGEALRITRHYFTDTTELNADLRALFTLRARTQRQNTQALNRLDTALHAVWPALSQKKEHWLQRFAEAGSAPPLTRAELEAVYRHAEAQRAHGNTLRAMLALVNDVPGWITPPPATRQTISILLAELASHAATLETLESEIDTLTWAEPLRDITGLWWSVPYASTISIAALHIATNCRADEFTADQFRAAVGCHPLRQESGNYSSSRENKAGYRPAKSALHLWTMSLIRQGENPVARYFYEQKKAGKKAAIHSARGKLARVLSGIARSEEECNW